MMNRQEIALLEQARGYPCLTITLPTHRTSPANRQDPIRLKNLARQATERLTGELGKREVETVLRRLAQLVESVDHERNLDGLALFVSEVVARAERVPFTLPERVMVDESFFTRDLVYAYNRSPRYLVLALSEQPTRLFAAVRDDLDELTAGSSFPLQHSGPGGETRLPGGHGVNSSQYRDDQARSFFRAVDQALGAVLAVDPLPVALVGVDRWQAFFREVTSHGEYLLATLTGSYDSATPAELGRLVWPLMRESLAARRLAVFAELEAAVGAQRSASTLGEVWRFAQEGRGAMLVVEEGYHEAARLDATRLGLLPANGSSGPDTLDDAVDEVVATVLAKGGRVTFVDDGTLAEHRRIALMLRY